MGDRLALLVGRIIIAAAKVDQQVFWQIHHFQNERMLREMKLPNPQDIWEVVPESPDDRVKMWGRLCRELSATDAKLLSRSDDTRRRLKDASTCRHDLAHGWIDTNIGDGLVRVSNQRDLDNFVQDRLNYDFAKHGDKVPRLNENYPTTYTVALLEGLPQEFERIGREISEMTNHAIMNFR
jgi:hypothetical protein